MHCYSVIFGVVEFTLQPLCKLLSSCLHVHTSCQNYRSKPDPTLVTWLCTLYYRSCPPWSRSYVKVASPPSNMHVVFELVVQEQLDNLVWEVYYSCVVKPKSMSTNIPCCEWEFQSVR